MLMPFNENIDDPYIADDNIANDAALPSQPAVWEGGERPDRHGGREGILDWWPV